MAKKIAILQSNYIPWKGYFDLIASVDEFILFDDVQFTRRDWRNRNQIKTPTGLQWLTVPVLVKGKYLQKINETEIVQSDWPIKHWRSLEQNYRQSNHFEEVASWLKPLLIERTYSNLSDLNQTLILAVCSALDIKTRIQSSNNFSLIEGKNERLISICEQTAATTYVSGPAARDYIDVGLFSNVGINVEWFSYEGYAEYPQLWGDFCHPVTILDLLFNCGQNSRKFMKPIRK